MKWICFSFFFLLPLFVFAQPAKDDSIITKKKYVTDRLEGSISIDGIPDEKGWEVVNWSSNFTQLQPNEGAAPSQKTAFKILYDNNALYIAYRCFDDAPDSIIRRMGRRDEFPGDWIEINIDSYHDLRTAFSFTLSASGVRNDEFASNDGNNWDPSWNPIWYAKTHIDDKGWTGEIKIPLSQLRYGNEPNKVWGIQVVRRLFRKEERSIWQYIPQNSGVWVSRFGELHGLNNIPMHRQVEIAPYVTAQADVYKKEEGNPFAKGFDRKLNSGIDGKLAVTNDLILDFTINPDFGQVEADPSQVRIDGFQNFFQERRPFFIESRNIFDYRITGSAVGGNYDSDLLFYSRRIGSTPHGYPNVNGDAYVKTPQNTSILGAAKFSGKTKKGFSVGILESITQRELATIHYNGQKSKELVEPLTNYFVGRLQQDYKGGNTIIGGIVTGVNRAQGLENSLHRGAYTGGLDFLHYWKNRTWYIRGNAIFSHVNGTQQAIFSTQTAFEHLFQRPGFNGTLDSTLTSLTGTGGTVRLGKSGGKSGPKGQVFRFETGLTYRSPQLELNDIGFMLTANEINHFTWAGLHFQKQFSIFRNARINYNHISRWDFSGKFIYQDFNVNAHASFLNNWQTGTTFIYNPYDISNNALRGSAAIRRPAGIGYNVYVTSDTRKKVFISLSTFFFKGFHNTIKAGDYSASINLQPLNALRISISGSYGTNWRRQDQYVSNVKHNGQMKTIVGSVDQKTLRFTGRLTFNITPDLTLQYYGQPFISRPVYNSFGFVTNPLAKVYDNRFYVYNNDQISFTNGRFSVDENKDGIVDYSFQKPDFNFVQFRSNFVARWEYKPGSELYLVWSQQNTPDASLDIATPVARSLFDNVFAEQARNIFLVKWTYRLVR